MRYILDTFAWIEYFKGTTVGRRIKKMKKIKFRAWDKENRTIYAWEDIKYIDLETLQKTNILMQFTGLKDKNGKEIFEGDILAYPDRRKKIIVIVKRVNIAYCEEYGTYANGFRVPEDYKNMIVIENIYENPDLLNEIKE